MGVDTLRMVVPWSRLSELSELLADLLGPAEQLPRGFYRYANGQRYGCGSLLLSDAEGTAREAAAVCVELKGQGIADLGQARTWELCSTLLSWGGRATRIDVRLDWIGSDVRVVEQVRQACERRELRGARVWEPRQVRAASGGFMSDSVTLGKRGKQGSGRYVRVYDKGLETGECAAGCWQRWEVEFSKEAAEEVAGEWVQLGREVLDRTGGDLEAVPGGTADRLAARALGAVDFREGAGVRLDLAPRAAWWAAFVDGLQVVPTVIKRVASSLGGLCAHVRRTLAPTIRAMSERTGLAVREVVEQLLGDLGDVRPARSSRRTVVEFAFSVGRADCYRHRESTWGSWLETCRQAVAVR